MPQHLAAIRLIVPTRDSWRLLPRLVHSLQSQTLDQWQATFIDASEQPETQTWLENLCRQDPRFRWQPQRQGAGGIFAAMNQGFDQAGPHDWLLFWGSDDWAAGPTVLAEALEGLDAAIAAGEPPDLLVASGRYFELPEGAEPRAGRRSAFHWHHSYRRSLLLGSTPPHQATLIGPGARRLAGPYRAGFQLAADLDHFLRLSRCPGLRVSRLPLELVHMGAGGISARQTRRRLQEVRLAYRSAFGPIWPLPFLLRYRQRLLSRMGLDRSRS